MRVCSCTVVCESQHAASNSLLHAPFAGRADCCSERLTNFEVRVGGVDPSTNGYNVGANPLCTSWGASPIQSLYDLACAAGPVNGRFVSIQLKYAGILTLCEVQVFGYALV